MSSVGEKGEPVVGEGNVAGDAEKKETARTAGAAVPKRLKTAAAAAAASDSIRFEVPTSNLAMWDRGRGVVRRNCLIMYQRQINLRNLSAVFRLSGSTSNNDDYDNELIFAWSSHTHSRTVCVQFLWME